MNTWVSILFAVALLLPTSVTSDEHQGSVPPPVVFHKTYSSGSEDQITGERSPRTIYVYPSSSGQYENSKYDGPVNDPKVLHSRYQASSYEGEPSANSRLNTFHLHSEGRNQNKNDIHEDYAGTSDSVSLHNSHSSDILKEQIRESPKFVHVTHDGNHLHSRDGQPDNLKYHSSRDNPSLHQTFSSQPDQTFDESVPRGNYILPPSREQHEQRFDGQHDSLKYHHSKSNDQVVRAEFPANSYDQSFEKSTPLAHHVYSGSSHEEKRYEPQRYLTYHNPSNPSVQNHDEFPSTRHDYSTDKSTSMADYETRKGDLKYHSQESNPSEPNHTGFPPNHHDHPFDQRFSKAGYETQQGDIKYDKNPSVDVYSGSSLNNDDRSPDMGSSFRATFRHPVHEEAHDKGRPVAFHSGISSDIQDRSSEKRASHEHFAHSTHEGSHELHLNEQQDDMKYKNSKSSPLIAQNSFYPNIRDQSFDDSIYRSTYIRPSHGNHKETQDRLQTNLTYHNPTHNPSVPNHNDMLSNPNNTPFDKSASMADYETQPRDIKYHSLTINPNAAVYSDIPTNNHDQPYDINTSSRGTFPNPHYRAIPDKDLSNTPSDSKYLSFKNSPSYVFHSGYSSKTHVQSSDPHLLHPTQRESDRETHGENEEHLRYNNRPSSVSVNHHNGFPSQTYDQSPDESVLRTILVEPPHSKTNWKNRDAHQEDLLKNFSTLSAEIHDRHLSNVPGNPAQNTHHHTEAQQPFEQSTMASYGFGNINPTTRPPNVHHNIYLERTNDGTGSEDSHQYHQSQLSHRESHKDSHNKQLEQMRYQDLNSFKVQKDRFVNEPIGTQDKKIHHRSDTSSKYESMRPEQNRGYEPHTSFPLSRTEQVSKHHSDEPARSRPFTNNQQSESHNSQDVAEHGGYSVVHHQNSGYVPYSGPYTKPQVMNDMHNNNEIASATVEPFGKPKAHPPRGFQISTYLNSQSPAGHTKLDTRHVQAHHLLESQHRENQNDHQNYGFSENGYSQLVPQALVNGSTGAPQGQRESTNTIQNDHFSVTGRSQSNEGYIRRDGSDNQYSSEHNGIPDTQSKISEKHSYSVPAKPHKQGNLNANFAHNSTRKEEIQTHPRYSYEGEYVNYANHNAYHTGKHQDSTPQISKNSSSNSQSLYDRYNFSKPINLQPVSNTQTHPIYQNNVNYGDRYSLGQVGRPGPTPEHYVDQVPVPNSQVVHNFTKSESFNDALRPLSNGGYNNGNEHSYSSVHSEDTRIQQGYTSQTRNDAPFINQHLRQNDPISNNPLVNAIKADNFDPAGKVQANIVQQDGIVQTQSSPLVDQLHPEIHHEYAFKMSYSKPNPIPQTLRLLPNSNQSEYFTVTPVPQITAGYLDSKNQHPPGLVGYVDPQHGYVSQHPLPLSKPIVLQSGYQEDTHEISHAKHDHVHVHHSRQSGYQYGIIN